jgi:recombination associated protein RdgC
MWFKNLSLLRLTEPFTVTSSELEKCLEAGRFRPCGSLEPMTYGWCPPLGKDESPLVHVANGFLMICAMKEEKILPSSVVNDMVFERVAEIEDRQNVSLRKKQRDEIREEVIQDLLPRAFSHARRTYAYLDPREGWLVIDSASAKRAEELASLLRRSIESLPVALPATQERPAAVMTRWLMDNDSPTDITIESECELRSPEEDGGIVRCKRQDLAAPEIQSHLEVGKEVIKLAMTWDDRLSFVLDESLGVKRLQFLDMVQDQAAEVEAANEAERFDVDFSIMTLELSRFLPRLLELFGGEKAQN